VFTSVNFLRSLKKLQNLQQFLMQYYISPTQRSYLSLANFILSDMFQRQGEGTLPELELYCKTTGLQCGGVGKSAVHV
jgi:hypothetical protein